MLRHSLVEVVLDHHHDGRGLPAAGRILVDGPGIHLVVRAQAVHVDAAVLAQLLGELPDQNGMMLLREVAQGILQGQHPFLGRQNLLAARGMVDLFVVRFHGRQPVGNAGANIGLKLLQSHMLIVFSIRQGPKPPFRAAGLRRPTLRLRRRGHRPQRGP